MSAVNDLTPLGIKEEDLNLLRNDHIKFDCGPLVYRTIIDWGFSKPEGKRIIDHINDLKLVDKIKEKCNVDLKKWMKKNESKLDKYSFSDLDITALHDFLPILCYERIAQTGGSKEYDDRMKDPNSVESLLKEIKAFRNDVSHEYAGAIKDNISKMRDTMSKGIRAAGKLYGKDQTEIDSKVKLLNDEFERVLLGTTHFYENRVKYIAQKISSEAPSNMLERYSPYFSVPLPGSSKKIDTSDIFQCSNLSVTTENKEDKTKDNKTVFPCTKIFNNKHEKFLVINGGPGSGKTTLMRNMCKNILVTSVNGSTPRYNKIEQFKIPIYLECRYEQQTYFAKFLKECLKDFLSPEDDIYEAFKIVKSLMFLIDGYDEITDNCRVLLKSIITFCRDNNASCIVSSRVDAGNNFVNELQDMNLNCTKMFIEPISEKLNFLQEFACKVDGSIDTDKLVKSFENLTSAAQEVFSSPILLALFISMFVHDPMSVSKMKNEQSAYEAVRANFLREMARKLKLDNVCNSEGRAKDVANVLDEFCLKLFMTKKYFLQHEDYLEMIAKCEKIRGMGENVDIPNLLTTILTPEHSFKYNQDKSYQFMHSTIQEFFAAKYVSENIKELPDDRSSQSQSEDKQLTKLQDDRSSQSQSEDKQLPKLQDDRSSQSQSASSFFSNMKKTIVKKLYERTRAIEGDRSSQSQSEDGQLEELQEDRSSQSQSEDGHLPKLLQVLGLDESQSDIKEEMDRYGNIIKFLILEIVENKQTRNYRNTFTQMLKKYYEPQRYSPVYYLDLILSSDSNADIISIVSDCLRGWGKYDLKFYRHIKPMTDVVQELKTAVRINFISNEAVNSQPLSKLITVLKDDSEISFYLHHSHANYEPQEEEFYTQLKKSKCKVTNFKACVSSEENLSILVRSYRGDMDGILSFSTDCTSVFSFAVLKEYKGKYLFLKVKYSEGFSITGNNPVREGTNLCIEHIPADGKHILLYLIKYLCPKFRPLYGYYGYVFERFFSLTTSDENKFILSNESDYSGSDLVVRIRMKSSEQFQRSNKLDFFMRLATGISKILCSENDNQSNTVQIISEAHRFGSIELRYCHLTDTDANELLDKLYRAHIETRVGIATRVQEER